MVEVEGQVVPSHAMKACRRSRCIAQLILNLGTDGGEWSASSPSHFTPELLQRTSILLLPGFEIRILQPVAYSPHRFSVR